MHSWSIFATHMSYMHTWTHKIHHGLNLGKVTTFSHIVFFVIRHKDYIQMSFCPKTPKLKILKFPKLNFLAFWRVIIFYVDLQLKQGLK